MDPDDVDERGFANWCSTAELRALMHQEVLAGRFTDDDLEEACLMHEMCIQVKETERENDR